MDNYKNNDFNILNGRINLFDTNTVPANNNNTDCYSYAENIDRNISVTCVSQFFFSKQNIDIIQTGIINSVFNVSEGEFLINKQSEQELKIIMRSIYLQYSKNLDYNIKEQILELNTIVIRWCVDDIVKNIKQYIEYKKSVSTLPLPMEHAVLPSQKGTKTLEIKSFI